MPGIALGQPYSEKERAPSRRPDLLGEFFQQSSGSAEILVAGEIRLAEHGPQCAKSLEMTARLDGKKEIGGGGGGSALGVGDDDEAILATAGNESTSREDGVALPVAGMRPHGIG